MHEPTSWLPVQVGEAVEADVEDGGAVAVDVTDELSLVDEHAPSRPKRRLLFKVCEFATQVRWL